MSKKEIRDAADKNQIRINNMCFILASGGIAILVKIIWSNTLTYSLIPMGLAILSWVLSIFYGIRYLISKGNYLSAAENATKDHPVNIDNFKAPKYIRRQVYFLPIGGGFFLLWLFWHLLANT